MSAFRGLRVSYDRTCPGAEPEPWPGPPHHPGNFTWESSNTPFLYPWGRKERNPAFIGPHFEEPMGDLRKYEKDERRNLQKICVQMNELHARMGGRDNRPERVALMEAMALLRKVIDQPLPQPIKENPC